MTSDLALRMALAAAQVALSPLLLGCWIERRLGAGERWFGMCGELLSLVPGWPGSMVRKAFYRATLQACAARAYISFGVLIVHRSASIGRGAYIGPYSIIGAARIGDDVKIASRVSIMSGRRQHDTGPAAVADAAPRLSEVAIGDGSWVGEGAMVMANVGRHGVVGAGSVVVRDVPEGLTVVGNPAHPVTAAGTPPAAAEPLRAPATRHEEGRRSWA